MNPMTQKFAFSYGIWVMFCLVLSAVGFGDGIAGHFLLAISGMPLALFSFHVIPNGSVFATFVAGLIGWLQWCLVVEINARWEAWRKSKNAKT
ncbi:hypothetical protein [Vogesella alkaliphila]|uniref:hypothetical protein n=1 Tax=Vogesella alkaliphila TaxID=1193621 RepID=UPI0016740090|nr:hypothetical protein [Vogesella alkaliphila]